jgi:2-iminobutanoate/2-iminopropanoate deaminase
MKIIQTNNALIPAGHYSQAVVHNDMVYLSGQLPVNSETGEKVYGSIDEQLRLVLANIKLILEEANSSKDKVIKVTIYIPDVSLWGQVDKIYADFFGAHKPARVVVPTRDLHYGLAIEVDLIAYI